MSFLDNEIVQSYINFATQDGTVHDAGANLMVYGPVVIALLALVVFYQVAAMAVTGVWRTLRGAVAASRFVVARVGSGRLAVDREFTPVARPGAAGTAAGAGSTAKVAAAPVTIKRTPAKVG